MQKNTIFIIICAIIWMAYSAVILLATGGHVDMQVYLMNNLPFSDDVLYNIYYCLTASLYIYLIWLERPNKFSFFHPAWWFATAFGTGYIARYFGQWWNYAIGVIAGALLIAYSLAYIPAQTVIAVLAVAIALKGAGTIGTIFACLLWWVYWVYAQLPLTFEFDPIYLIPAFGIITICVTLLGIWASQIYVNRMGADDPSEIVIDEVAGMFLTILLVILYFMGLLYSDFDRYGQSIFLYYQWYLIGLFVLFRIFDIFKPYPIKKFEQFKPKGWGIMADDLMAGFYAAAIFIIGFSLYFVFVK